MPLPLLLGAGLIKPVDKTIATTTKILLARFLTRAIWFVLVYTSC